MGELHPLARLALDHAASARERPGRCDIQGGGGRRGGRSRCDARRRRRAGRAPPRCAGAHRGLLAPELAQGVPRRPLTLKAWREILGEKNKGKRGHWVGTGHTAPQLPRENVGQQTPSLPRVRDTKRVMLCRLRNEADMY